MLPITTITGKVGTTKNLPHKGAVNIFPLSILKLEIDMTWEFFITGEI